MSELSEIKLMLKEQNATHKEQTEKLDDIHFAIFGNKEAGVKGMAKIQEEHSNQLKKYERFQWIATGATASGWAGFILWIRTYLGI